MGNYIFTKHNRAEINEAILAADPDAEIWENGISTALSLAEIDAAVPSSCLDLRVMAAGEAFTRHIRDGFTDTDEQGFVRNSDGVVVGRH